MKIMSSKNNKIASIIKMRMSLLEQMIIIITK